MTKWTIYTERNENLSKLVDHYFDNATLINASGIYKRKVEDSTIIEIIEIDDFWYPNSSAKVANLVNAIKEKNKQECVLVTEQKLQVVKVD